MGKSGKKRHENTFKFQTFSERITNINIDVIHQIKHVDDTPEENSFYFGQGLEKWNDLNCTDHFTDFRREILDKVQTFEQLVHHEDEVVDALKKHLKIANSLALEPLLDLVVQLARDLQSDFYRHFTDFFHIMIELLNKHPQDSELLEHLFTSLSYLFKFLWRYLVKDIEKIYGFFSSLLGKPYKEYVRNFAAESFAFLMRKVKDHSELFDFLFASLRDDPDKSGGVGRLLFEMLKGVKNHFHSTSPKLFPVVLSKLGPPNEKAHDLLPLDQVEEALTTTLTSMLNHATKEFIGPLLDILLNSVSDMYNSWSSAVKKNKAAATESLERYLRLLNLSVVYKKGRSIPKPDSVAVVLIKMLKGHCLPEGTGHVLLEVVSSLLVTFHAELEIEKTAKLASLVYKTQYPADLIFNFTKTLFHLTLFEKNVLPSLLLYCQSQLTRKADSVDATVLFVTQLVLNKCPTPEDGDALETCHTYLLDFGVGLRSSFPDHVRSMLTVEDDEMSSTAGLSRLWSALVCLPHVRPLQTRDSVVLEVVKLAERLRQAAASTDNTKTKEEVLYVMSQCVVCLLLMEEKEVLYKHIPTDTVITCLRDHGTSINVLRLADMYLAEAASGESTDNILTEELFTSLVPALQNNLMSACSRVRLLTLRILSQFSMPLPPSPAGKDQMDVFTICLCAEKVPISVQQYREKVVYLQKLDFGIVKNSIPVGQGLQQIPLRYLLGCLYFNFELLWEPIRQLIATHALGLPLDAFWEVYGEALRLAADKAEELLRDSRAVGDKANDRETPIMSAFQHELAEPRRDQDSSQTFFNFRFQAWKTLQAFPEKCEPRSKEFVPLLFRFLSNEYYLSDLSMAPTQNVLKFEDRTVVDMEVEEEEEEGDVDDGEGTKTKVHPGGRKRQGGKNKHNKKRKGATSYLIVKLEILSKMKNPKALTMENQLRNLYLELLVHKNARVQKVAFECLLTYKDKYLMPYKENFERLLDDGTFRSELVVFSIDHENSIIKEEHRDRLIPILMRILYGKMQVSTGKGTSGKSRSSVRQSIIFRFLNGSTNKEMTVFIDLVFGPFKQFVSDDPYQMVKDAQTNVDFTKMFPVKKILGTMNSIELFIKKLGHLLDVFLPSLLKIILGLASLAGVCLDNREKLTPFCVNTMKTIRQSTVGRLMQFFEDLEDHDFTPIEMDAVFEAIVWPQVEKLHFEGLYHPTPLLKLFHSWTKRPKYFPLLGKHQTDNTEVTPLHCVFKLLLAKDISKGVADFILTMVDNLLSYSENDDPELDNVQFVHVNHLLPELQPLLAVQDGTEKEFGVKLLLPHVPEVFKYLHGNIDHVKSHLKQDTKELSILSRISSHVSDREQCNILVGLLLPFLGKKMGRSQKSEEAILTSIVNLMKLLRKLQHFYRPLVKLLASIQSRQSRDILCQAVKVVCEKNESLKELPIILFELNSWNERRMEEMDYGLRLEAFRKADAVIKAMETVPADFCLALVYNSCHFITKVDDMSIRESGTHCIVTMVKQFEHAQYSPEVFHDVITHGLLIEVKQGLRSRNETVRHEFITVLEALIETFPEHASFADMAALKDKDIEVDFFQNIKHIQIYRRAKALGRLLKHVKRRKILREIMSCYYLPLVSSFLVNDMYKKQSGLRDAAVATMGVMCRQLPWHEYHNQLKFYLGLLSKRLDSQKLLIRHIVSILNAFHFDLSASQLNIKTLPVSEEEQSAKEEKKPTDDSSKENSDPNESTMNEDAVPEPVEDTENKDDTTPGSEVKDTQGEVTDDTTEVTDEVYRSRWTQVCSATQATSIHTIILKNVIVQLRTALTAKAKSDDEHKLAKKKYAEDEEILRVPLAVAMVKLLQRLPKGALERHLPGILLRVCYFLKSRSNDIRTIARSTMSEILASLGPRFFPFILNQMRGTLKRGYQVHVLCFTVHQLLQNMTAVIKPGDIDVCLPSLHEVFKEEIFGEVAEEKDVEGIVAKVFEARKSKSYESYQLIAQYIGRGSLIALIDPIKKILESTTSHKSARKIQEVLKKVAVGLFENKDVDLETMMVFIHGLVADTLPRTSDQKPKEEAKESVVKPGQKPQSCLLLPVAPPRGGFKAKASKKTNLYILVEFGLHLLNMNLKRLRLVAKKQKHLQMLDPLVPLLAESLYSKHVRINSSSLRCLCWVLKFPLPSLKANMVKIANGMFILLKNYASAGSAKGDNLELVSMSFKAVTVLVRDVQFFTIQTSQLQVLLTFCEEDLYDFHRQSTAFSLLRAILTRKLDVPEMWELMNKIQEMSITADSAHVRRECRQVALQYIVDYPLGKKIRSHLEFYVTQLTYELESGRESALEMLATFFSNFPQRLLTENAAFFFIPMSVALVNDESPKCRKLTALAIKSLLEKLDHNNRNSLFSIAVSWFKDEKLRHRTLAAQLMGLFVEVESTGFERHLRELLPVIQQQIEPGQFDKSRNQSLEHDVDHMLYNILNTLLKILRECGHVIRDSKWRENMNILWEHIHSHLLYPHTWVQLATSQLCGLLFAAWQPDELVSTDTGSTKDDGTVQEYLKVDLMSKLRSLSLDFIAQLRSPALSQELASQVVKNMVFLGKVAKLWQLAETSDAASGDRDKEETTLDEDDEEGEATVEEGEATLTKRGLIQKEGEAKVPPKFDVVWLVKKMVREAHHEAIYNLKVTLKRSSVFKWLAAISLDLGAEVLPSVLRTMVPPLQREINSQAAMSGTDSPLKNLAQEVLDLLKRVAGFEKFTEVYADTQRMRTQRKDERKKSRAIQAVANPEIVAKRKLKKNLAKKEAKKRKFDHMKPSKKTRKRNYEELVINS